MGRKLFAWVMLLLSLSWLISCGGALSSTTFDEIRRERIVPVGTVPFEPPLLYQKGQALVGPEAKLAERIVDRVRSVVEEGTRKIELKWVTRNYSTLVPALKNRELDLVIGVFGITEEGKQEVAFSEAYYTSQLVLIINPSHQDVRPNMLRGLSIGVREGTAAAQLVQQKYSNAKVVPFQTLDDAVLALKRAEIDAAIDDRNMAAYSLATVPGVEHLEFIPTSIGAVECAVAVRKEDQVLLDMVNEVVAQMKAENIYPKWLQEEAGDRITQVEKRHAQRLEKQRLAEQPRRLVIRVSKNDNYDFDIYKMANLSFNLIDQQTGKSFITSRIDFQGRVGVASATVPPGTYRIVLPKFNNWSPGSVPVFPSDPGQVTVEIRLLSKTSISLGRS